MEDGRITRRGTHEELLDAQPALRRDRRQGHCRASASALSGLDDGEPDEDAERARGGAAHEAAVPQRLRAAGRQLRARASAPAARASPSCCAPTAARVIVAFLSLVLATAASLAPPYLAKLAIDDGITPGDLDALNLIVAAFIGAALLYWGATYLQTYLVGWVGQRALQDLRLRIFTHLQRQSIGFFSRRKTGVLISRLTNDVAGARPARHRRHRDAVLEHADADRHDRDPAAARRRSWRSSRSSPRSRCWRSGASLFRYYAAGAYRRGAREDRERHRVPAGDAVRRARSCAPSARSRATCERFAELNEEHRAANYAHGLPERRLLPRRRAAVVDRHRR